MGALNSYRIEKRSGDSPPSPLPPALAPLNELKSEALGTWYISAAAVFDDRRGRGHGSELLKRGAEIALERECDRLTLMVGSFNVGAHRLYLREGFTEQGRRPFVPFPSSDKTGEWILMSREVGQP